MNVDAFVTETANDLGRFWAHWKWQSARNSEAFPMELPPGEWLEQFLMFASQEPAPSHISKEQE